jgi:hypothetical protein
MRLREIIKETDSTSHESAQLPHDYTAKSYIGKGIEWPTPTKSSQSGAVNRESELEMPGEHHSIGHSAEGVTEDADASSTSSADIATVAYPLFVKGKTKNQKRRAARRAVGQKVDEAHTLDNTNVIYRLDKDRPMSDTEVAVLGGAGRYSLEGLRNKARREAQALARDLEVEHGGAFRRSAENVKQLTNTLNTIVAAYNELNRIRRKGGRGARGITDEDANFIRECMSVATQWTTHYKLIEGLTKEPDPQGYEKNTLSNPQYTIVVNTPGDLDWYKIGTYWNKNKVDPHEFGQDDSDTVLVAQGEEEYKEMLAKVKKMGLTYKIIGGTTDQPEIHDKA